MDMRVSKTIIPAEADMQCDCCLRIHRKLWTVNGYKLGRTCKETYALYLSNKSEAAWFGYEKQLANVEAMLGITR